MSSARPIGDNLTIAARLNFPDTEEIVCVLLGSEQTVVQLNFSSQILEKLNNSLEKSQSVLQSFMSQVLRSSRTQHKTKQSSDSTVHNIFKTVQRDSMQGHLVLPKMLSQVRKRYYAPTLRKKYKIYSLSTMFKNNATLCMKKEASTAEVHEPCDGCGDVLKVDILEQWSVINGYN